MERQSHRHGRAPSRRDALALLGAGAAVAALPATAGAQGVTFPKGAVIRTVLKDYTPEELAGGVTLFHEHMSLRPGFLEDWNGFSAATRRANARPSVPPPAPRALPAPATPPPPGGATAPLSDEAFMVKELTIAKNEGIGCIVDAGHPDMGRSFDFLKKISQASGLPVVCSAGYYTQPFYPKEIATWSENQIFDEVMKQVKANPTGALGEIGSWDYISKDERKVFRAMGKVQKETGLGLFTHTGIPGKSALEQLDLLEDAGADPKHIVIGHLGNLVDATAEMHRAVIRRGAFVGIDRVGATGTSDAALVSMVKGIIDDGYADNLMFSSDLSSSREMKQNGGGGYSKTWTIWVPKLRAAGVSEAVLHKIMYDNPRRFLAFVPKIKR
jgi:phosphotriesterase-related protein